MPNSTRGSVASTATRASRTSPSRKVVSTVSPGRQPSRVTDPRTVPSASKGVQDAARTWVAATSSSQTVRQIPEERRYQMTAGSGVQACLPRGISMSLAGSDAATTNSCSSAVANASVMSRVNGT